VIVYFEQFFGNWVKKRPHFWANLSRTKGYALVLAKMDWATFWANFLHAHLVTLTGVQF
jgi:hypothetical protein